MAKKTKVTTWVTREALRALRDVAAAHKLTVSQVAAENLRAAYATRGRGGLGRAKARARYVIHHPVLDRRLDRDDLRDVREHADATWQRERELCRDPMALELDRESEARRE